MNEEMTANTQETVETQETIETQETTNTQEGLGETSENVSDETIDTSVGENEFFGKPENYDYKDVKLPEGMQLDENLTGKFSEYASKLNLSQKSANEMMAMAVELTEQTQKQVVEAMGKLQEQKIEGYKILLNQDKEVGGAKLKESIATANVAYDGFFKDEGLRELLAEAGLTVHPKFIKALKSIGREMEQDRVHVGNQAAVDTRSREDILYPSMNND